MAAHGVEPHHRGSERSQEDRSSLRRVVSDASEARTTAVSNGRTDGATANKQQYTRMLAKRPEIHVEAQRPRGAITAHGEDRAARGGRLRTARREQRRAPHAGFSGLVCSTNSRSLSSDSVKSSTDDPWGSSRSTTQIAAWRPLPRSGSGTATPRSSAARFRAVSDGHRDGPGSAERVETPRTPDPGSERDDGTFRPDDPPPRLEPLRGGPTGVVSRQGNQDGTNVGWDVGWSGNRVRKALFLSSLRRYRQKRGK